MCVVRYRGRVYLLSWLALFDVVLYRYVCMLSGQFGLYHTGKARNVRRARALDAPSVMIKCVHNFRACCALRVGLLDRNVSIPPRPAVQMKCFSGASKSLTCL